MRIVYNFLFYLMVPVVFGYLLIRSWRDPAYRRHWPQRWGFVPRGVPREPIWIHVASMGEAQTAVPLIEALRARYPDVPVVATTMTPNGRRRLRSVFGERITILYVPIDVPGAVSRFLRRVRPRLGVLIEAELWPNLLAGAQKIDIPMALASARLSPRSRRRYERLGRLLRDPVSRLDYVAVQSADDAAEFQRLGVPSERVEVVGNLKLDLTLPREQLAAGAALRERIAGERPVWICASTREGEEEQVLDAFVRLRDTDAVLLLVPRHPERFDAVAERVRERGFTLARRSADAAPRGAVDVFLGDTMGELIAFYAAADVAFVGGSLVPAGGHNPLEPAAVGIPIAMGPNLQNVGELAQALVQVDVLRIVQDDAELAEVTAALLADPARRARIRAAGKAFIDDQRGRVHRLLERLTAMLEPGTRTSRRVG